MTEIFGNQSSTTQSSDYNSLVFFFNQMMLKKHTMTLVKVVAVSDGSVDVQPLVNQLDGSGNPHAQGVLYALPVFRLQGGRSGIIVSPQIGDIGLAIFADRDISAVIATKAQSSPPSRRVMSMSDGVYLCGVLNSAMTQYIMFGGGIVDILSASTRISGNLSVKTGATGGFTTPTGSVVTVVDGIITNIT